MADRRSLRDWTVTHRIGLLLGLIVIVGVVLRLIQYGQSVGGDELSTLWIVRDRNLGDVIDLVRSDAEITPPLNFVLSWFAVQLGSAPELVRLPALLSGIASIPLVFLLGRKLLGERAGLIAAALMALSPFMVFFSGNGRAYTLMVLLLIASTIAMLKADQTGRNRWWVAYGAFSCLAMYSHYTALFVLAAQLGWLLLARPASRLPGLLASAGAAVLFLPWLPGLRSDLDSPTTDVLQALQGDGFDAKLGGVKAWAFGHPFLDPNVVPGKAAVLIISLALLAAAVLTVRVLWQGRSGAAEGAGIKAGTEAAAAEAGSGRLFGVPAGLVLIFAIAIATPLGEMVLSLIGTDVFGARNMTPSWYGFALLAAAVLTVPAGRAAIALTVVVIGGYGFAVAQLVKPANRIVGFEAPARVIDEEAAPGDVVVDVLASLTTPVPLTAMEAQLESDVPVYSPNHPVSDPPFLPKTVEIPQAEAEVREAFRQASGHRVFLYAQDWVPVVDAAESGLELDQVRFADFMVSLPEQARIVDRIEYPGVPDATLYVIEVD